MRRPYRLARVNVKAVVVFTLVIGVLGTGAVIGRQVRRQMMAAKALADGSVAFDKEDWQTACKNFGRYLVKHPDDPEVLEKYARAQLCVWPFELSNIEAAIRAYRKLIRLNPDNEVAYHKLLRLYAYTGEISEVVHIARQRLQYVANDPKALLWLGRGLIVLRESTKARDVFLKVIEETEKVPGKHPEYVEACQLLKSLAMHGGSREAVSEASKWLDRAVDYDPKSAKALVARASFYRTNSSLWNSLSQERLAVARIDLERADELGPTDPRVLLELSIEWMEHGEFDRAAAKLEAANNLDNKTIKRYYLDVDDWLTVAFLTEGDLALRRRTGSEGIGLASEALATLAQKRHRFLVLPTAVRLFVAGNKVSEARGYLDEYLDLLRPLDKPGISGENVALLQAMVARAEGDLYRVIDVLEPVVMRKPSHVTLWKLLAEGYSRTGQSRRSIRALLGYLRFQPQDKDMTLNLAREYIKQREWNKALDTARLAEPLDPTDIVIKLLRIEASIYAIPVRPGSDDKAWLETVEEELAELRKQHPDRVEFRILQAIIAVKQDRFDRAER